MSRPELIPEIDLCGVMRVRKARHSQGWTIGEPYTRRRRGEIQIELARPGHFGDPVTAVVKALLRAEALAQARDPRSPAIELLRATAPTSGAVAEELVRLAATVRPRRQELGLGVTELAGEAGIHRATLWSLETGRHDPTLPTLTGVLGALERAG